MIDIGDVVPNLAISVTNSAGAAADAVSVVLTITLPDGTTVTPTVVHGVTGAYSAVYVATQAGLHLHRWVITSITGGDSVRTESGSFQVDSGLPGIISLTRFKKALRITTSDTDRDETLREKIQTASGLVEDYTNCLYRRQTVTETHDANSRTSILLRKLPVISITSVSENGSALAVGAYSVSTASGLLYRGAGPLAGTWAGYGSGVTVTYVAGDPTRITASVAEATEIIARHLWDLERSGSNNPRQSGGEADYDPRSTFALPRRAEQLLSHGGVWPGF